jgi:hypothetical protein
MRISVSSWATTESDVDRSLKAMLIIAAIESNPAFFDCKCGGLTRRRQIVISPMFDLPIRLWNELVIAVIGINPALRRLMMPSTSRYSEAQSRPVVLRPQFVLSVLTCFFG